MTIDAAWLMLGLLFAHYLGDFTPLATARMLEAKANGRPLKPIAGHAGVHAALVGLAVAVLSDPTLALLAGAVAFEFVTHFFIDAVRGRLGGRVPSLGDPSKNAYWYLLGIDQFAHGTVLVAVAAYVL